MIRDIYPTICLGMPESKKCDIDSFNKTRKKKEPNILFNGTTEGHYEIKMIDTFFSFVIWHFYFKIFL